MRYIHTTSAWNLSKQPCTYKAMKPEQPKARPELRILSKKIAR